MTVVGEAEMYFGYKVTCHGVNNPTNRCALNGEVRGGAHTTMNTNLCRSNRSLKPETALNHMQTAYFSIPQSHDDPTANHLPPFN